MCANRKKRLDGCTSIHFIAAAIVCSPLRCTWPSGCSGDAAGSSSSNVSNPWLNPLCRRSTYDDTKPPVVKPASLSACWRNRWPGFTLNPMLSRTPCSNGSCPDRIDV
jgi:hypothetical protein